MKNGKDMRWKDAWSSVHGRMGMVFLAASAVSVLIFLADNRRTFPQNEKGEPVVNRGSYGEGNKEEELYVQIGDIKEPFTLEIAERKYTSKELEKVFRESKEQLEKLILGENETLEEVRSDLHLITEIPGSGIRVSWELDQYSAMNIQGELQTENLTESGTFVRLKAILSYEEETCEYQFYAKLYPPLLSSSERVFQELKAEIARIDEETRTDSKLILPESLNGERVLWSYGIEYRALGILLLGAAMSLFLYASEQQKQKSEKKEREQSLTYSYPQMVSKFTLYIRAGMTPKNAWYKIAGDYEKQKNKQGQEVVYDEMVITMREMRGGAAEGESYEHFGERCGLPVYRKFGAMLSQNLKKGTKGMAEILKQEADNAFEERKRNARKLGEEAGTKMLLPMFLMLAVVLIMIIIPAFLTVQI